MKNKRELKEFNISNRFLYTIIALSIIITLGMNVYASGGTHTMGELTTPCTNGIITSSGGTWGCIQTPIACTGTNQVLQWSGSAWSCVTVDVGYACTGSGWQPSCACLTYEDPVTPCGYTPGGDTIYAVETLQQYCSYGYVTQTRTVWCCTGVGGPCQAV